MTSQRRVLQFGRVWPARCSPRRTEHGPACLWFDGVAEEAAAFYTALLPNSHIQRVRRSPADSPSGPAGMVLTVDFTLAGQRFSGLSGGPHFRFNEAVSFVIECEDQLEVDRQWAAVLRCIPSHPARPRTRTCAIDIREHDQLDEAQLTSRILQAAAIPGWSP